MATLNESIPILSGVWANANYEYRVYSIANDVVELQMYYVPNSQWSGNSFKYNTSTGTWFDTDTSYPNLFSITSTGSRTATVSGNPTKLFGWADASDPAYKWEINTPSWSHSTGSSGGGGGTSTEGVYTKQADLNKSRLVLYDWPPGTYELDAMFGNGDAWSITIPSSGSYTLYPGGTEASPANSDSLTEFADGTYELFSTPASSDGIGITLTLSSVRRKVSCNFW